MRGGLGAGALLALLAGCAYYNAMWSAERFAGEARGLEARGREAEARLAWTRAAVKAESMLARHPRSRWADDALVLWAEARARAGTCAMAAAPIAQALRTVGEVALRERAALAAAHCALADGHPVAAERVLAEALASDDPRRRSQAELLAGRAAAARLDHDAAAAHFRRSAEPPALPALVGTLLAAGRAADAAAALDTLGQRSGPFGEADWAGLLDQLAAVGGTDAASLALDRMLERGGGRVPFPARARLLTADGDRRLAAGKREGAIARYQQAMAAAPAANEARVARVRVQRALVAGAAGPGDLTPVVAELRRLADVGAAAGTAEAQSLLSLLTRVATPPETPGAGFRAAELARDSLDAPRLAGRLFLLLAAADSTSLFAPKALVAALPLLPDRRDSIVGVLDAAYARSPYTRALHGEATPAYAAAEDSLARELGVQLGRAAPARRARVTAPLTGPRGPWLEEFAALPPPPPRDPVRPRVDDRPGRDRTDRPTRPARP